MNSALTPLVWRPFDVHMFIMPNAETYDDYVYGMCMHNVNKFYTVNHKNVTFYF